MTLQNRLKEDLIDAVKKGDALRVGTFRMVRAALHNGEIEKKSKGGEAELNEEEVVALLRKEAKKRSEAAEAFLKGGRIELAEKEKAELAVIKEYLPPELSEAEIMVAVDKAIDEVKPIGSADFGKVMGVAMKELKGRADASAVSGVVKTRLAKK